MNQQRPEATLLAFNSLDAQTSSGESKELLTIPEGHKAINYFKVTYTKRENVTALSLVANTDPYTIINAIHDNGDNTVTIRFYDEKTYEPKYYTISKSIPTIDTSLKHKNCAIWVSLFEKAYIQHRAGTVNPCIQYNSHDSGQTSTAIIHLIGTPRFSPKIHDYSAQTLFNYIKTQRCILSILCLFRSVS